MESVSEAGETVPAKCVHTRSEQRRKKHGRAAVTNGTELQHGLADSRSVWVRRIRDVIAEFYSDFPEPTAAERSIIRRVSTLVVVLEKLEVDFANAGEASGSTLDLYQRTAGNLRRLLQALGIKGRRAVDLTPTLDQYLADKAAVDADTEEPVA
jgi:hypothetical protein